MTRDSPNEFVDKKTERARVITVRRSRRPERRLFLERADDGRMIEDVHLSIQRGQSGLMRKQLCQRDLFFPGLRKLRPELGDALFDVDLVFLQDMQSAGAAQAFCGGPNEHERVVAPRDSPTRIPKSAVKIDNRFSMLPNRHRGAELAELLEIFLKQWRDALAKLAGI